jgi:hypothetical protein
VGKLRYLKEELYGLSIDVDILKDRIEKIEKLEGIGAPHYPPIRLLDESPCTDVPGPKGTPIEKMVEWLENQDALQAQYSDTFVARTYRACLSKAKELRDGDG